MYLNLFPYCLLLVDFCNSSTCGMSEQEIVSISQGQALSWKGGAVIGCSLTFTAVFEVNVDILLRAIRAIECSSQSWNVLAHLDVLLFSC